MWRFPDHLPANEDLSNLMLVLSGSSSTQMIGVREAKVLQSHDALWTNLRTRYPELFQVAGHNLH
jgi:hypothetical protein